MTPGGKLPTNEGGKAGEKVLGALLAGAPLVSCSVTGAAATVLGKVQGSWKIFSIGLAGVLDVGLFVSVTVGKAVLGIDVDKMVGSLVIGDVVGDIVGLENGGLDGIAVGYSVGAEVAANGGMDGVAVGYSVGAGVAANGGVDGVAVGYIVGAGVAAIGGLDGVAVGYSVGAGVAAIVGCGVGLFVGSELADKPVTRIRIVSWLGVNISTENPV